MLSELLEKHEQWKHRRFLKKHGCETWDQYNRFYDPDYNLSASRVQDYYHGYLYWHIFDNDDHYCYRELADYGPGGSVYGFHKIDAWCKENLKNKFRLDYLRVHRDYHDNQWTINELGGQDRVFIAFKDERDYIWFMLKYSN